jgi:hypothetical protein
LFAVSREYLLSLQMTLEQRSVVVLRLPPLVLPPLDEPLCSPLPLPQPWASSPPLLLLLRSILGPATVWVPQELRTAGR